MLLYDLKFTATLVNAKKSLIGLVPGAKPVAEGAQVPVERIFSQEEKSNVQLTWSCEKLSCWSLVDCAKKTNRTRGF